MLDLPTSSRGYLTEAAAMYQTNHGYKNHNKIAPASRPRGSVLAGPIVALKPTFEWSNWDELTVIIRDLRHDETTYNLWRNFSTQGEISWIDITDRDGNKSGTAKVRFSPPPRKPFWTEKGGWYLVVSSKGDEYYSVHVSLVQRREGGLRIRSPLKPQVSYEPSMKMYAGALHFGIMIDKQSMMPHHQLTPTESNDLCFCVDLRKSRIVATFNVEFNDPGSPQTTSDYQYNAFHRVNKYRIEIPFTQLKTIHRLEINKGKGIFGLLITLDHPPQYYRKRQDERSCHSDEQVQWNEYDTWYRQTDLVYNPYLLQTAKVTLHKEQPVIDIGRWTTYLFEFSERRDETALFETIKQALQDYNIGIVQISPPKKIPARPAELWGLIDPPKSEQASVELSSLAGAMALPFEVRYQLEVCISHEYINEYNISAPFVKKLADLAAQDPAQARNIMEYVAGQDKRVYNPMSIFDDPDALAFSAKTDIPHYCAYVRKATITPSTIYFNSPTVETTNRVLRRYARENLDGRFLRVQFTDELSEGRINACAEKQRNDELFTRVYRTLYNGIQIGDRHYEFLAFGNSQFRENGAYFFCPTEHLSCNDIRQWMGNFSHIPVVAKYAARLGQCFSTTRAIPGLSAPDIIKIADVERGEYCFTDGVGKISPFLAKIIAAELKVRAPTAPSAFQFRLGGCKGILAVWPEAKDKEVHIRKSQQKFTAVYNGLEIIRCAQFSSATLNRQTITILSSLGVADEVFVDMLTKQLAKYQSAMHNDDEAVDLLLREIDDNQMTINIATMIRNGFMAKRDPFVMSLLHLWRSWSNKLLKEKARITVDNGAFVLGCVDETGTLRGYTKPKIAHGEEFAEEDLPQIFIQVPDKVDRSQYNVIEGVCLVGRNPSLHPGDLRVVQAVNIPALHHLRDVVVFPLGGDRDIPSMCSGGDLDGDDFFVIWDENLRPPEWNCDPMNYTAPKPKELSKPVEITDLMKFFVRFMKNDSLPTIAHAHLAHADFQHMSVKDTKCLELAALHSKAVDYVKTGDPAQMPKRLRPGKWPHFMEKKFKSESQTYHSNKILGQLYDKVETVNFIPQWQEPFDKRILQAYSLNDATLKSARQVKTQYDTAMKRLMAQQDVRTEFEIWSTFVLSKPRVGSGYKLQEEIARLSEGLKDQFRAVCRHKAGGDDFDVLGPFVAAMYKVTKEELDIALAECRDTKLVSGQQVPKRKMEPKYMPLITFPWLFEKELGRIATGIDASDELEDLGMATVSIPGPSKRRHGGTLLDMDDFITQEDGVIVHRGEELDLFRKGHDSDDEGGIDEAHIFEDDHLLFMGRSGEAVLATEFDMSNPTPDYLSGGTGVEDVVPRTELEGLIDPHHAAQVADEFQAGSNSPLNDWHFVKESPDFLTGSDVAVGRKDRSLDNFELGAQLHREEVADLKKPLEELADLMDFPEVQEEDVNIDLHDSPLEELSESVPSDKAVDDEEEIIDLAIEESAFEKLARALDS
ncbi:RdRP-domain-containing protein [Mollisia scopiformis]|uniref:RNA-dependent RNA polymerase n=1 Tax=Mollisia scopiformis TaxID=149040 RepID=A0A132B4N5_MOLSC|nr:RdRP-domain-containing protein [Mollisia scopiformis]KUJ07291.1 RdRP-domain-containing protein [Mollisia scopiformis]